MITVSNLCGVLNATKLFYFQSFFYNLSKTLIKKTIKYVFLLWFESCLAFALSDS